LVPASFIAFRRLGGGLLDPLEIGDRRPELLHLPLGLEEEILGKYKTVAVVGLSSNPQRPSHRVARYLKEQGYRIIPVNPRETEVLGEQSSKALRAERMEDVIFGGTEGRKPVNVAELELLLTNDGKELLPDVTKAVKARSGREGKALRWVIDDALDAGLAPLIEAPVSLTVSVALSSKARSGRRP
jgi:hypothetical protein